jgi:hypothetical protein
VIHACVVVTAFLNCWVPAANDIDLASMELNQLGEVGERTGKAVGLADDYDFDLVALDIGRRPPKGRAIKATVGIGWVTIPLRKRRLSECASSARRCALPRPKVLRINQA